ncbi:uncharacterized protein LOC144711038 [Wolffia australiana]
MGSAQSSRERGEEEEEEEEDEEDDEEDDERRIPDQINKKVLEQEPEILPCQASASPLSPQLSLAGTPRLAGGPSIKVWDPCNVLAFSRGFGPSDPFGDGGDRTVEIYLINHGECGVARRQDLIGGRWPAAALTGNGERQARALAVFLNSQNVRFNAVYSSPLDRSLATAAAVCQELGFSKDEIQTSDSLTEMSQGQWEGCHKSEVYTPHMINLIEQTQPDFCAPSGESLRQVEFRMMEFVNRTVLGVPQKLLTGDFFVHHQAESRDSSRASGSAQWDLLPKHGRQSLGRKRSGKSRLQVVAMGENDADEELPTGEQASETSGGVRSNRAHSAIAVFSHAVPIKCLLTGILGSGPLISNRICVDDSSVSVMWHSLRTGWQVKRVNDTAHLRLL